MRDDAYKAYLNLIKQWKEDPEARLQFDRSVLHEYDKEPQIVFICKNYMIEGGLSQRLHSQEKDLYQIKATLGKGLGLSESGTHIAFTAGTGILAFVDLAALMLRANLGLLSQEELPPQFRQGSTFKFILYVACESKQEGIGYELLEGLQEVTKKRGLKNFELIVRLSGSGSRWDADYISRQLSIHEHLEKVWVCGPPAMNELFDRTFETLRNDGSLKLNRQQVEIM